MYILNYIFHDNITNMMIKNKKGIGLEWYLLIVAFFLGLGFYFVNYFGQHKVIENYIGYYQLSALKAANKAESALFYIDQSAKYSLSQSIYELAQNGGIYEIDADEILTQEPTQTATTSDGKCGSYYGYNVWYELKKDKSGNYIKNSCFDDGDIKLNLEFLLNKNLNQYLLQYPYNLPVDNYVYEIKNNLEIIGRAIEPLKFDILKDETKSIAKEITKTKDGSIDFSGTELCAKGVKCLLNTDAYQQLADAEKRAEENGFFLEVYSAYRSKQNQIDIWEGKTSSQYKQRYPNENIRRKYVCYPYGNDVEKRCPHLTGKAIDVRLKGKSMIQKDWQLLKDIMATRDKATSSITWVKYSQEPWHFECCGTDRFNLAKAKGVTEIA